MENPALESYLKQVEKYLPPWKSSEILREIRSHAMDEAEELAAERGVPIDDALLREVVAKLGPAERLAAGYTPAVALIRPEYTMPFAMYALAIVVLLLPFTLFSGLAVWLSSSLLAVGLLFAVFVVLSRSSKIRSFPLWHPGIGKLKWHVEIGRGMQKGVEAIWPMTAVAGAGSATASSGGHGGSAMVGEPTPPPPEKRRTPMEWMISKSGPRPLRIDELIGAGIRIVFGFAVGLYFALAPAPLSLVNILYEHPRWGWHLIVQGPGFDELRAVGVFACFAMAMSGLVAIFLGRGRISIYSSILSKIAWAVLFFFLATGALALSFDFQTTGWVENDWPQVKAGLQTATPIFFFVLFGITLLTLVGRFVRLGLMEAWHRENDNPNNKRAL